MFLASRFTLRLAFVAALVACASMPAFAQGLHNAPSTDTAGQASPLLGADPKPAGSLPGGLTLTVRIDEAADSGSLKNGQLLRGTLLKVDGAPKARRLVGGPVQVTVVASVPAGKIYAAGELSLAVTQVGTQSTFTDIVTFRGTPGKRDLPDSAPAIGTNAGLQAGATLTFHSQGTPQPASGASMGGGVTPGSVAAAVANGSTPAGK